MKLIDKYLLRTFFLPLFYCMAAFLLVFIIFDLFDNLSDFIEAHTPILQIFRFYMLLVPSLLIYVIPVSLFLATLYSLSQLTKNNELTAMRASGVSLYRLMLPFIIVGVLASILVAFINETIAPWSAYWTNQYVDSQRKKGEIDVYKAYNLAYKNEDAHRLWLIGTFDTRTCEMERVELVQQRPDGTDEAKIQARKGRWLDGRWWLIDVASQRYNHEGEPVGAPLFERERELTDFNETPSTFIDEIKEPQYLSARELLQFIRTHKLSPRAISRHMVDFHSRLAMPWTCLIVMLLGIPFGVQTGRKGALMGITISLLLFFVFYIVSNLGVWAGKTYMWPPLLVTWLPNLLFIGIGSMLIHRMR